MRRVGLFSHPACVQHDPGPGHPERPERLRAVLDHLRRSALWPHLTVLEASPAPRDVLERVHPPHYVDRIREACRQGPTALDPDTIAGPGSWEAAVRAAGAVTGAIDRVLEGSLAAGFCAVRPPGHHADIARAMGFCLFNNVAVGARHAQARHRLSRVLIVDWDVHHGNGTQAIFEEDPSVLYFSTHQFPYYPGTGAASERGRGRGEGFTLNVPLSSGSGDEALREAFEQVLAPRARAFRPELILISAGFDAHHADPLAGLAVTEEGYRTLTRIVRALAAETCQGRLVSVLEGGYQLAALAASVEAHVQALLEEGE